ncbi:ribosome maturation factor RimM [Sediminibacterium ginsengisoli]|uniref:Ribosome maturation factor RimM n=1 Tax=Sediminibacterium ginsengisoli TaxID=413434 RepID=A0A1T4NB79_9BACT|nr:ribosome maturation factor RimM [Sediminibacterium ginsengisoli]SJZ76484.1 16S rRNA processing protein RimM [Sediminibacterium ginsengisoli]
MNEYIHIGRMVASFGLNGELILKHALGNKALFKGVEVLFIEERKGSYLPYFIESAKAKNEEETYIKLEGVQTKETANRLTSRNVWLQDADFRKLAGKAAPIALIGFKVITDEDEDLGPVEEVIEQPHQVLLRVSLNGNEALIPLHAETLDRIDQAKKEIHVSLPDGLLDIYR